jgi:hypothetical protein
VSRRLLIGLTPALAVAALIAAPVLAQAANPPHYFINGTGLGARASEGEKIPIVLWGTLGFSSSQEPRITCDTAIGGWAENPGEGTAGAAGVGEIQSFNAYDCEDKACTASATSGGPATYISIAAQPTAYVSPAAPGGNATDLGWKSHLLYEEPTKLIRSEIEGIKLEFTCHREEGTTEAGEPTFVTEYFETKEGSLRPSSGPLRPMANNPPFLEFDFTGNGSGFLGPAGPFEQRWEGELKVLGYDSQEVINAKLG